MQVKLLIFDLDGTLVDSAPDICLAVNHAVAPYGLADVSLAETIELIGEGAAKLIAGLIEKRAPGLDAKEVLERFLSYYSAHLADHSRPFPGTEEVLASLADKRKAVISNKLESFSVRLLDAVGLLPYFDYVAGGDTHSEKKPSPVPILSVLSRFGVAPGEALFVGDSVYDVRASIAAGVRAVAALYGYGAPGFADGADHTMARIGELPDIVGQLERRNGSARPG
jgi:phosphoglycolate phosphatase